MPVRHVFGPASFLTRKSTQRITLSLALLLAGIAPAGAQWIDRQGGPVPETPAAKSVEGFGGVLITTADADWREKWDTPANVTPHFSETDEVSLGGTVTTLIMFSNPMLDADRRADVTCDLQVIRPDGSFSMNMDDTECYQGPILADPTHVYMAKPSLQFLAEPSDPPGVWTMKVTLRDNLRGVGMKLEKQVTLKVP